MVKSLASLLFLALGLSAMASTSYMRREEPTSNAEMDQETVSLPDERLLAADIASGGVVTKLSAEREKERAKEAAVAASKSAYMASYEATQALLEKAHKTDVYDQDGFEVVQVPLKERLQEMQDASQKEADREKQILKDEKEKLQKRAKILREVSDGDELPDTLPKPPPKEKVETPAPKGTTVLPINDAPAKNFEIGQELVLDAGTPIEEYNRVAAFGSVILEYPLEFDHSNGVEIGGVSEEEIDAEDEEDPSSSVQEEKEEKVKEEAQAGGGEDSAPGGGEDSAPAGGDIAVGGATATLDAAGFLATTSLCCPVEMEAFFNRLLDKMGLDVCSKPHVQGLMHWFHCVPNMDFQYMIDVINNGNPCKYWGPKGQECPVLSPECDGRWCR